LLRKFEKHGPMHTFFWQPPCSVPPPKPKRPTSCPPGSVPDPPARLALLSQANPAAVGHLLLSPSLPVPYRLMCTRAITVLRWNFPCFRDRFPVSPAPVQISGRGH